MANRISEKSSHKNENEAPTKKKRKKCAYTGKNERASKTEDKQQKQKAMCMQRQLE